jgi:hypothetical protein
MVSIFCFVTLPHEQQANGTPTFMARPHQRVCAAPFSILHFPYIKFIANETKKLTNHL